MYFSFQSIKGKPSESLSFQGTYRRIKQKQTVFQIMTGEMFILFSHFVIMSQLSYTEAVSWWEKASYSYSLHRRSLQPFTELCCVQVHSSKCCCQKHKMLFYPPAERLMSLLDVLVQATLSQLDEHIFTCFMFCHNSLDALKTYQLLKCLEMCICCHKSRPLSSVITKFHLSAESWS